MVYVDAFDTDHLLSCMEKLRQGEAVDIPKYDCKTYKSSVFRRVPSPFSVSLIIILLIDICGLRIMMDTCDDFLTAPSCKNTNVLGVVTGFYLVRDLAGHIFLSY